MRQGHIIRTLKNMSEELLDIDRKNYNNEIHVHMAVVVVAVAVHTLFQHKTL